jgi:hypothetical protein
MASNMPGQSNLLVEGVKISYGLRAEVSAVLLIFSRFSPPNSIASETSSCTGHSGHMHLGPIEFFSTQFVFNTPHGDGLASILAGLQPWKPPVVASRSLVNALFPLLEEPLPNESIDTPMLLKNNFELPHFNCAQYCGWDLGIARSSTGWPSMN